MNLRLQRGTGAAARSRPWAATVALWFCLAASLVVGAGVRGAASGEPRRVLLINSFGRESYDAFAGKFRDELLGRSSYRVDIYEVSLESARVSDLQEQSVLDYIESLFAGRRLDLVVPIGGPAVRFAQKNRARLFPRTPMLLAAVDQRHIQTASLTSNDTVVAVLNEPRRAIENILQVLPQTTNVALVIGTSPIEQIWLGILREELQVFTNRLTFLWWNTLSFPEMLNRSAALPRGSAILYGILAVDAEGVSHVEERALAELHSVARAPLFGLFSNQMGHGIVGGPLLSMNDLSRNAAEAAIRILRGEAPAEIKTPPQRAAAPMFDWRELRRWGIPEASIPQNSTVLFRQPTVWQEYRGRIMATGAFLLIQSVIIFILLANLMKRQRAERSLAESEARFQNAANSAPVMVWMAGADKLCTFFNKAWLEFTGRTLEQEQGNQWTENVHPDDLATCLKVYEDAFDARREFTVEYRLRRKGGEYACVIDNGVPRFASDGTFLGYIGAATDITAVKQGEQRWRAVVESAPSAMLVVDSEGKIMLVNGRVETVFGYARSELIGQPVEILVPDAIRAHHPQLRTRYMANPTVRSMEARPGLFGRRKDGTHVPVEIGLNPIRTPEGPFVLASIVDITERLAAETRLRESDRRMKMAADAANLGTWVWDVAQTEMWASDKWRAIHGYTLELDLRYESLLERVHPEDRDMVERAVAEAFNGRDAFHVQHRLLLPDGAVRWISTSGRLEQSGDNGPLRMLGISIDVTERKEAEEAAREVSGKLITAQEDERRRIARDLHDDLNQRLALLSVETDLLTRMDNDPPAQALITDIATRVRDLSSELHKLSYQLHPAKLYQLGLVAAVRSFCHEMSDQCGFKVEFVHQDIPKDVDDAVALSCYRIVQEALQNVLKHSGATRACVDLRRCEDHIALTVSDNGHGFDMAGMGRHAGLGLVGMRERVRLVHGCIALQSVPGQGTRIEVGVPLCAGGNGAN